MVRHECGSCHGLNREGGLGSPLTPEALTSRSVMELVRIVLEGKEGTAMPPWEPFLSRTEARWLVRSLKEGAIDGQ